MNKDLSVSRSQMQFLESDADYTLYCGGIGSGKTFAGALWAVLMSQKYPGVPGMITANTHSQLKKATLIGFFKVLDMLGLEYTYKQQDGVVLVGDTRIYAMSMENYDVLRGIEVGWCWSDECAFYKSEAFDVCIGRIRDSKGPCHWKGTTTPNGYNWLYRRMVQDPVGRSQVIYSKTADNAANLGDSYIKTLEEQYDPKLARQELQGEFVNLSEGIVYSFFDRNHHVRPFPTGIRPITVGLDFNVDPMCGVYCVEKDGNIYVTQEIFMRDSNTFEVAEAIKSSFKANRKSVVADSTGDKRRSSAKNTDHEILRRYGLNVLAFKNPFVKDRQNNVNRLFYHGKLFIDPKCKKLIEDLEQLVHDNKDDMLSHISDALGYACWHLNPLKKPRRSGGIHFR